MQNKGKIGVTSENIFPIIKKFLYSEHDIFLRELVANAVDATTKLQTIATREEGVGELGDLSIKIDIDKEAKTLSITDKGVGLTEDEVERYINQIAFSGAEDFLKKYEGTDASIIGHFGLGFYSAFMVASKVEIDSLSFKPNSKAIHWTCEGDPEYELTPSERKERGTTITLHLDSDSENFLEKNTIQSLLNKYCRFLPIPIIFGKKEEWKEGKMQPTDEDNQINNPRPIWTLPPADVKEEQYREFYHDLYPGGDDPLFHIHLNVDYPFTLKGILYFPKVKETVDPLRNKIQLYCNQVFVTDKVEGIVPDWLMLLEGVIDSPDIPLNVSRSYLQQDASAKKITNHIGKKVADTLSDLFKNDRTAYENKWDSLGLFVQYGMLTDDKTYDRLRPAMLLKDIDNKAYTMEEYRTQVAEKQTNKEEQLVILYATDPEEQYVNIQRAKEQGYNVLLMNGPLSLPFLNMLEEKEEKIHFARVDSDSLDKLIEKEYNQEESEKLSEIQKELLKGLFEATVPNIGDSMYSVEVNDSLTTPTSTAEITSSEWMRRMKDMSRFQSGMSFYDSLPDSHILKVYAQHPVLKYILSIAEKDIADEVSGLRKGVEQAQKAREELVKSFENKKEDELTEEQKEQRKTFTEQIEKKEQELKKMFREEAEKLPQLLQIWDLALMARNLLNGDRLANFIKRSEKMLQE